MQLKFTCVYSTEYVKDPHHISKYKIFMKKRDWIIIFKFISFNNVLYFLLYKQDTTINSNIIEILFDNSIHYFPYMISKIKNKKENDSIINIYSTVITWFLSLYWKPITPGINRQDIVLTNKVIFRYFLIQIIEKNIYHKKIKIINISDSELNMDLLTRKIIYFK